MRTGSRGGARVTVLLGTLLVLSVGQNVGTWVAAARRGPRVVGVEDHPDAHRALVDFDAVMVAGDAVGAELPVGRVTVEPAAPLEARFITPNRLEVRLDGSVPAFTRYAIRFASDLTDLSGRPVDRDEGPEPAVTTGRLDLAGAPRPWLDEAGAAVASILLNGPVRPADLERHLRLLDAAGTPLSWTLTGGDASWDLRVKGAVPRAATLVVAAGLESPLGPRGFDAEARRALAWPRTVRVVDVDAEAEARTARVTLALSHALVPEGALSFVSVDPPVPDLAATVHDARLVLSGAFPPGRTSTITLKRGLPARHGLRLESDVVRRVLVPEPRPHLAFAGSGSIFPTSARPEIRVEGVSIPAVEIEMREVFASNVVPLALGWTGAGRLAGAPRTVRRPIDAPPHEPWEEAFDLAAVLGRAPRGTWLVRVSDARDGWPSANRVIQRTDLAPLVRVTPDGAIVLVRDVAHGTAVEDAHVVLYDEKDQVAGEGRTDGQGLLVLRGLSTPPVVCVAETADDRAYVDLGHHAVAHDGREVAGRPPARGLEAFLYSDRGAVRPGETARVGAILRGPDGRAAPAGLALRLELVGPDARVRRRVAPRIDRFGAVEVDLPFADDAPTGTWRVRAFAPGERDAVGEVAFRVEAIVPDRIEPSIELPPGDLAFDEEVRVRVRTRLLTGEPTPDLPVTLRVRYAPSFDTPVEGFRFGDRDAAPEPFSFQVADDRLDAGGDLSAVVRTPAEGPAGASLVATFEAEVVDRSGRAAFARTSCRLVPAGPRLGVAAPPDEGFVVPIVVGVASSGNDAAPVEGEAVLERLAWEGGWVEEGDDRPVWRSSRVATVLQRVAFRATGGRGEAAFDDPGEGWFRVSVSGPGARPAALVFTRYDGHASAAGTGGGPRLSIAPAEAVAPGGTAVLEVEAPFAGPLLLTLEAPGVLQARVLDLEAGRRRIEVPLPDVAGPGLYATATLLRGAADAGDQATRLLGACWVEVRRPARRLDVSLEVPPSHRPESDLEVTVRTSAPAWVHLVAVDEGVLRLTGHPTPDPQAFFLARRRLDTRVADAWARLAHRLRFGGDDAEPGGDALAVRMDPTARKTIETVALAAPPVVVDGSARIRLALPAWDGRLRVMAVASGVEGTGSAEAGVVVAAPIRVAVHGPRAAAPGDVFDVALEAKGDGVSFDVGVEGLDVVARGGDPAAPSSVTVRAREDAEIGVVTVTARDAEGHVVRREARVRLRAPTPFTVAHVPARLDAGASWTPPGLDAWRADRLRARLVIGPPEAAIALPPLERLLAYPHGCVEQTTSRAIAVLAWSSLWQRRMVDAGRPDDVVDAAVDRVLSMQTADGGLSLWPGGGSSDAFGSAYGAEFLIAARAAGRAVPEAPFDRLLDHLARAVLSRRADAYTVLVLARAGRDVRAALERVVSGLDPEAAPDVETAANLATAFELAGEDERARRWLDRAGDPWGVPRESGGWLRSPVRAAAVLLEAITVVRPDDPRADDLVSRLGVSVTGAADDTYTTQDDARALLALARFASVRADEAGPSRGVVLVSDRRIAYDGDLVLDLDAGEARSLRVEADTQTALTWRVEGFPRAMPATSLDRGIRVHRTIEGLVDGRLRQGHVYRVVLEGEVEVGHGENLLVTDVLPGGLEVEAARGQEGTLAPDRVESRDERVLFFRAAPLRGAFRQTYLVRAVTPGRWQVPPVEAELLYAPDVRGRGDVGGTLEVVR